MVRWTLTANATSSRKCVVDNVDYRLLFLWTLQYFQSESRILNKLDMYIVLLVGWKSNQ